MREEFLWTEKYRPHTVKDTILPENLKETFQGFVNDGNVPNLILNGTSGVGKTTIAMAMLDELGCDYIKINGSTEGRNIDTLRTTISQFASSVSLSGGRKYVIVDEADYMNPQSVQPGLRGFMEEFSKNCGFIFTCNFSNRIIEPLHSRCSVIEFKVPKSESDKMAMMFFERVIDILNAENVEYSKKVLVDLIIKHFPDNRRVLNELQRYASRNSLIDEGILTHSEACSIDDLVKYLKVKDFTNMRKWVSENMDSDVNVIIRKLYENASKSMDSNNIPQLILILAEYQYKAAFAADQEINLVACLTEIMVNCEFIK